jgi:hypothetical protein
VEKNFQWFGVGSEHHKLGDAAVQRLGRLVGALLQLLVVLWRKTNRGGGVKEDGGEGQGGGREGDEEKKRVRSADGA